MRDLPTIPSAPASVPGPGAGPGVHRALGAPLLGAAVLLLVTGVFLGGGVSVHGTARAWLWALAVLSVLTLAASFMRARTGPGPVHAPGEVGPWGLLSRAGALAVVVAAVASVVRIDEALMLPAWSDPGTYLWSVASWVALLGAVLTLVFGALPPVRSRRVPLVGGAIALALTLVVGSVVAVRLPYEHGPMNLTGDPTVPETVDSVAWSVPPGPETEIGELHPTAHGALVLDEEGLYGVHPGRDVRTWSYRWPGEQLQVVVRAGGEIVDVLLPGRESFLSLDTLTGERVVPPRGSGRPVPDPSGESLVTQVGAHTDDVLWEYRGEEGCLPRAGGQARLPEENVVVVGTTVVVSLLCAQGLSEPVEGDVLARHLLVGLDSVSGDELWRYEEADARTEVGGDADVVPLAPGTSGELLPPMAVSSWGGDAVAFGDGVYLDAADGTVLYEGPPLEEAPGDEHLVLTDFGADSYVVALWPRAVPGERLEDREALEVRFEERDWDGRVLRATAPVQRSAPPSAAGAQPLADAVVHPVDGGIIMVQPWDGSAPARIDFEDGRSSGAAALEPEGAPLPQAVPGAVLLHAPSGTGLVGSLR